jgi:hypothetical protein
MSYPSKGKSSWRGSARVDDRERHFLRYTSERRRDWPSATRRRIGQALALCPDESAIRPLEVVDPERDPVVVSEVELGGVAVQMRLADVKVAAVDPTLEDREIIFGSVGVPEEGADVFLGAVVHGTVSGELPSDRPIDRAFVGHEVTGAINVCGHYRPESLSGNVLDVEAADPAIALDQRQHGGLGWDLAFPVCGLAANESLIALNYLICTAERTRSGYTKLGHRFADAMPEEPRCFQPTLKGTLKLAGADALLRGAKQIDRLKPHSHWNVAGLEHSFDLHGEWLAADITLAEPDAIGLAPQPTDLLAGRAAMWAHRTIRPEPRLDIFVSGFFAVEMCGRKLGLHGRSP